MKSSKTILKISYLALFLVSFVLQAVQFYQDGFDSLFVNPIGSLMVLGSCFASIIIYFFFTFIQWRVSRAKQSHEFVLAVLSAVKFIPVFAIELFFLVYRVRRIDFSLTGIDFVLSVLNIIYLALFLVAMWAESFWLPTYIAEKNPGKDARNRALLPLNVFTVLCVLAIAIYMYIDAGSSWEFFLILIAAAVCLLISLLQQALGKRRALSLLLFVLKTALVVAIVLLPQAESLFADTLSRSDRFILICALISVSFFAFGAIAELGILLQPAASSRPEEAQE